MTNFEFISSADTCRLRKMQEKLNNGRDLSVYYLGLGDYIDRDGGNRIFK